MSYYFSRKVQAPFSEALERTRAALASEGFGVVSEIDMQATLKAKLGASFRNYVILGACNPALAHEALLLEDKVGAMLPCNVVVQDVGDGLVEVAAIDPVASMSAIENDALKTKAALVGEKLKAAVDRL
jgi:uncharacterized protein (DUF302 family)